MSYRYEAADPAAGDAGCANGVKCTAVKVRVLRTSGVRAARRTPKLANSAPASSVTGAQPAVT